MTGDRLGQLLLSACFWGTILTSKSVAQITPDNSLGNENSILTENASLKDTIVDLIEGGAVRGKSLFHSFSELNVSPDQQVYFANPQGIENIFTRVTGNNISEIFGRLGVDGNADLFLLNPNGIVFGENASLDVGGSFLATTADSLVFKDDLIYSATNRETPPLLKIKIPKGLQFGSAVGSIEVRGAGHQLSIDADTLIPNRTLRPSGLEVSTGNTLALVGGQIDLNGGNLTAPEGRIELASVAQSGLKLKSKDGGLVLDFKDIDAYDDINLTQASSLDVSGDRSGSLQLRGQNITLQDSSAFIANKFGSGKGGEIDIVATNSLDIIGNNTQNFPSGIFTQTEAGSKNNGSNIDIETTNLKLQNDALIVTTTAGKNRGGDIKIEAQEIDLIASPDSSYGTGVFSQVLPGGKGKGGKIEVELQNLQLLKNAQIISEINDLDDIDNDDLKDLIKETNTLFLQNGGQISSSNNNRISIKADRILVKDASIVDNPVTPIPDEPTVTVDNPATPVPNEPTVTVDNPATPVPNEPTTTIVDNPTTPVPNEPTVTVDNPATPVPNEPTTATVDNSTTPVPNELTTGTVDNPTTSVPNEPTTAIVDNPVILVPDEPTGTVDNPTTSVPDELTTGTVDNPTTSPSEPTDTSSEGLDAITSDVDNVDIIVQQEEASNNSSAKTTYIFESDNSDFVVSTEDLVKITEQSSIFNSTNVSDSNVTGSNSETEANEIFLNSLLFRKSSEFGFDLSSSCRTANNDSFVSIGKGGIAENPLTSIIQNTVLPDWDVFSRSPIPESSSQPFSVSSNNKLIVEAQAWKINQNGRVELVATSDKSNLAHIPDRTSCLR